MIVLEIIILLVGVFAAAQGTVPGPNQKYWLAGAWLVAIPLVIILGIRGIR